ncbi:hypothetical protein TNIN_365171 [Trichonephila inaurata madagascariensis]|uniref:Uncharacterized protein n=1 Tax=Trichonephila inaurata madagascariensis TaxID=2747483 RepID=A0A8X6WV16_9ARAC|nr:hypothetical protein TNIN_365171 [Trichonephila inaurata madagascariensis]
MGATTRKRGINFNEDFIGFKDFIWRRKRERSPFSKVDRFLDLVIAVNVTYLTVSSNIKHAIHPPMLNAFSRLFFCKSVRSHVVIRIGNVTEQMTAFDRCVMSVTARNCKVRHQCNESPFRKTGLTKSVVKYFHEFSTIDAVK